MNLVIVLVTVILIKSNYIIFPTLKKRTRFFNNNYISVKHSTDMSNDLMSAVTYECMSCGTFVTAEELSYLPEIKCICGFRVFRKVRQPIIKQLKAV